MTQSPGAAEARVIRRPVLLIILDGFGFNPATERAVLDTALRRLPAPVRQQIEALLHEAAAGSTLETDAISPEELLKLVLSPVLLTVTLDSASRSINWEALAFIYHRTRELMAQASAEGTTLLKVIDTTVQEEAEKLRYTIWSAGSDFIHHLRNNYPTVVTQASGLAAGYEDLVPAVQGNSETGHQQIGNFIVAAQVPLEISSEIADGSFFRNPVLLECLGEVKRRGSVLDVCFLLSGEYGDDGRVHSSWDHLKALLEAAFVRSGLSAAQLRLQAILDGRDSPPYSSVQRSGDRYGFLLKLRDLLSHYRAEESLAWIIGRSLAMDRDYEEARARQDYELLVEGRGKQVATFAAAIEAVRHFHEQGFTDTNVPPIVVGQTARRFGNGDVFLDLNFRADRQRAKVAWLLGAKPFLTREAAAKGQRWDFDRLKPPANLAVYCLSEYHPDFEAHYGAKILYSIRPQAHNLFAILAEESRRQAFSFHYLLTAESTKALHVGYFIRGRREQPSVPADEERHIIPSYGAEFGVATDDDYYKAPQMRSFVLADFVVESLATRSFDLIAVNLSNTDMIGHLLPRRFESARRAVTLIDTVLQTIVPAALRHGYDVVLTADHGNVEDNDSSHTANDILTSFISADGSLRLHVDPRQRARLFDIPWSIIEIMGLTERIVPHLPPVPAKIAEQGLVGHNLLTVVPAMEGATAGQSDPDIRH
ncbi:MAG: hypothetical protein ACR2PL_26130 [Dehalococcoidia bacterium]